MSRATALVARRAEFRASRDAAAWKATQALLRSDTPEALEWAAMADEDNQRMSAITHELRAIVRKAQA